jgi:hypothetical protein
MSNEPGAAAPALHTLIPLDEFKAVLGIDDREDKISTFCLITATYTIEQYCKRRLVIKRHFERFTVGGDFMAYLREYPVREVLAVYRNEPGDWETGNGEIVEPDFYRLIPDIEEEESPPEDTVFCLSFSPALFRGGGAIKAVYRAGYGCGEAPADLAAACLELASWNMSRYRGRRVGITGNVRGTGKDGEHLELSMPENVRLLLEPYCRRVI